MYSKRILATTTTHEFALKDPWGWRAFVDQNPDPEVPTIVRIADCSGRLAAISQLEEVVGTGAVLIVRSEELFRLSSVLLGEIAKIEPLTEGL